MSTMESIIRKRREAKQEYRHALIEAIFFSAFSLATSIYGLFRNRPVSSLGVFLIVTLNIVVWVVAWVNAADKWEEYRRLRW